MHPFPQDHQVDHRDYLHPRGQSQKALQSWMLSQERSGTNLVKTCGMYAQVARLHHLPILFVR